MTSRMSTGEKWMIVNFTQKEFLAPNSTPTMLLRHYIDLFEEDNDGYSRWMDNDMISWVSTRDVHGDVLTTLLCDFQNVYGYKTLSNNNKKKNKNK